MTTETPTDPAAANDAARTVYLFGATPGTPRELMVALLDWARANNLDPDQVIGSEAAVVDLAARTISYKTPAGPDEPGAKRYGRMWVRPVTAPLLVEPPAELRRPPLGHTTDPPSGSTFAAPATGDDAAARLAAIRALYINLINRPAVEGDWLLAEIGRLAYMPPGATPPGPAGPPPADQAVPFGWARYARTCDPDRLLSGLGDLCYFLGGEWGSNGGGDASFTAHLLKLIVKAQATPERFVPLARAFPREVLAWQVWMNTDPMPTAAGLCAALTALTGDRA